MAQMGLDLSISSSEVHGALKRLELSGLLASQSGGRRPVLHAVEEFLVHGLKYAFPPRRGEMTRGVPTSYAAGPLSRQIVPGTDPPPVWAHPEGPARGISLEPLYRSVPAAALRDPALYRTPGADRRTEGRPGSRTKAGSGGASSPHSKSCKCSTRTGNYSKAPLQLLRPLLDELVFVGGCATGLLITDAGAGGVRPTRTSTRSPRSAAMAPTRGCRSDCGPSDCAKTPATASSAAGVTAA